MPRKTIKLATTYAERSSKRLKTKSRKATTALAKKLREGVRAKRRIAKGLLLPPPMSASSTTRRKRSTKSVSVKLGKRRVTKGCSTAGKELKVQRTSRAGKYLVTICKTKKRKSTASASTKKRSVAKRTTKSAIPKVAVAKTRKTKSSGNIVSNIVKGATKVVKSVLGGKSAPKKRVAKKTTIGTKKQIGRAHV